MNELYQMPIFCDNCSSLALASLDGAPLCAACLEAAIDQLDDSAVSRARIEPLAFEALPLKRVPVPSENAESGSEVA